MGDGHRNLKALCLLLSMLSASVACRAELPGDHAQESSDSSARPLPIISPDGVGETLQALPSGKSFASLTQRSDAGDAYPPPKVAAISLDEARRRTAVQLDPDAHPELVLAGALAAGALASRLESAFTQWDAWYRPAEDPPGRWLFLVLYRQQAAETDWFEAGQASDDSATAALAGPWSFRRREEWVAGIWDIETGQRLALGLAYPRKSDPPGQPADDLGDLTVHQIQPPLLGATVTAIPVCPGPGCGRLEATPEPAVSTRAPQPLRSDAVDPVLRESLRDYPLLPGNRWTRRYHLREMGLGCSATVTETLRRLDRLPGKRALATLDRSFSADGPDCLRRGWIPWLARGESRVLLDGRDVYLLPSDFAVETLLEALARPTPSPPASVESAPKPPIETYSNLPLHDPWSAMPFPTWRLMTIPGETWPTLPGVSPYGPWVWSATGFRDLQTSKLRLPGCTVAAWGPNQTCCTRAFCPGVGIVLEHFHDSGSTWGDFIVELIDYELAQTVDAGW